MKTKLIKFNIFFLVMIFFGSFLSIGVRADELNTCDFLPCDDVAGESSADAENVNDQVEIVARFAAGLVFVGFIGYGVYKIIKASLKIVRSESNAEQLQEGQQSIKGVFIGIGMIFIGIIGLVILAVVFNSSGIFNNEVEEPAEVDVPLLD